jgi:hypothetical protein
LPWTATSYTGKSRPFFLRGKGTEKVDVLILDRVGRAGVQRNGVEHRGALCDLEAGLDVGSCSHCDGCETLVRGSEVEEEVRPDRNVDACGIEVVYAPLHIRFSARVQTKD